MGGSLRIGLLPQGGTEWIAGVIYTHNVIRAVNHLPENQRPKFLFLFPGKGDLKIHQELGPLLPSSFYYFSQGWVPRLKRFDVLKRGLMSFKWPHSLEGLSRRLKLDVIFPTQVNLGDRFPLPWIGWIPDFQHKRLPDFF